MDSRWCVSQQDVEHKNSRNMRNSNGQHLRPQIDELIKLVEPGHAPEINSLLNSIMEPSAKSIWKVYVCFVFSFLGKQALLLNQSILEKCCSALSELCRSGYFRPEARIVAVHTGGLQGTRSGILASH